VETITAEQAVKDAQGLTFEKVWAALMVTKALQDKTQKQISVLSHAQENGLFVVVQTGDSVAIADSPAGFTLQEW